MSELARKLTPTMSGIPITVRPTELISASALNLPPRECGDNFIDPTEGNENVNPFESFSSRHSKHKRRGKKQSNCILPPWYPRIPLNDITAIVKYAERIQQMEGEFLSVTSKTHNPHLKERNCSRMWELDRNNKQIVRRIVSRKNVSQVPKVRPLMFFR